jgi:hypothetical protein
MSDDKVLVSQKQLNDLIDALRIAESYVQTAFARAQQKDKLGRKLPADHPISVDLSRVLSALAQPSDGALTNEPFCYTTTGMVEVAKAIQAGSGIGRVGAKLVKDDRFCVPLHLSPPAPAAVILPPAPEMPEEPLCADDDSYMDAYHAARRMRTACAKAIEAAGLKVAP